MTIDEYIGDRIAYVRSDMGVLQRELAESIGMTRSHFILCEKGRISFSVERVYAIAEVLRVNPNRFLPESKAAAEKATSKMEDIHKQRITAEKKRKLASLEAAEKRIAKLKKELGIESDEDPAGIPVSQVSGYDSTPVPPEWEDTMDRKDREALKCN